MNGNMEGTGRNRIGRGGMSNFSFSMAIGDWKERTRLNKWQVTSLEILLRWQQYRSHTYVLLALRLCSLRTTATDGSDD